MPISSKDKHSRIGPSATSSHRASPPSACRPGQSASPLRARCPKTGRRTGMFRYLAPRERVNDTKTRTGQFSYHRSDAPSTSARDPAARFRRVPRNGGGLLAFASHASSGRAVRHRAHDDAFSDSNLCFAACSKQRSSRSPSVARLPAGERRLRGRTSRSCSASP
jgi:hypothetical protein